MNTVDKLRNLIRENKVIPVVGAGVSYATAGLPGWQGLVEQGLAYATEKRLDQGGDVTKAKDLLKSGDLTGAAFIVKKLLGAPNHPFSDWLNDLFAKPAIRSADLIRSIQNLCTPIIATTNYDSLLDQVGLNQNSHIFDWSEHEEILHALQQHQRFVLHLHGRFSKPQTTIFGADDYQKLEGQLGYKSVLQQCWTTRHLLFIGCSKEGVMDDDFSTVLRFMQQWFPSFPHEHYILMREDEIAAGKHLSLLKDHNIHAISFGEKHEQLPDFINAFNPNMNRLVAYRDSVRREIGAGLEQITHAQRLPLSISSQLGDPYYWIDSDRLQLLFDALDIYNKRISDKRQAFELYQAVIKDMVSVSELRERLDFWIAHREDPSTLNTPDFIQLGMLAYNCLHRLPGDLLEDIRHRGSNPIHPYFFTNYLGGFVQEFRSLSQIEGFDVHAHLQSDNYFFENLKRIIASLWAVLQLKPEVLFSPVRPAQIRQGIRLPCLLFQSSATTSLHEMEPPYRQLASLPGESDVNNRSAELLVVNGRKLVAGHSSQTAFYWDPENDLLATTYFHAPQGTAVHQVFHYFRDGQLISEVFCGFAIYHFIDFTLQRQEELKGDYSSFIRLPDSGRRFCVTDVSLGYRGYCLYECIDGQTFVPLLTAVDLLNMIKDFPVIQLAIEQQMDTEKGASIGNIVYPYIQNLLIRKDKWQGRNVFIIRFQLAFWQQPGAVLMIFDPESNPGKPISIVVLPDRLCMAFGLLSTPDSVGLICGYLNYEGNLMEYVEDLDKDPFREVSYVPKGSYPRDPQGPVIQDIYDVVVITEDRVILNEENRFLIDVDLRSMTFARYEQETDVFLVTPCRNCQ